ncbi:MAG TPA: DUF4105 domain-containing protein [Candidatus Paceibacterota bacterium]
MFFKRPSHERNWSPDQAILPHVEFVDEDTVRIRNIRHASYRSRDDYDVNLYDETFDLRQLRSADLFVSPFWGFGIAHSFLIFRFADGPACAGGRHVSLSVEVRRQRGEQFSIKRMMPQEYELMYVFAHEDDVVRLRSHVKREEAYLYPLVLTPEQLRIAFLDACQRANEIVQRPEFYHVLLNNCTNNYIVHLRAAGIPLPRFSWRYLLPASIDELFVKKGLIEWNGSIEELRRQHYITAPALSNAL